MLDHVLDHVLNHMTIGLVTTALQKVLPIKKPVIPEDHQGEKIEK